MGSEALGTNVSAEHSMHIKHGGQFEEVKGKLGQNRFISCDRGETNQEHYV